MNVDKCYKIFELFLNENRKPPSGGIINSNVHHLVCLVYFILLSIS